MKSINYRRRLAIGLVILLAATFLGADLTQGMMIYVDDDNTSGPWDGTPAHPYQYIQDGIDAASSSDTVFVLTGTYYENVVVDKSIELRGEDNFNTVIDAGNTGIGVHVTSDSANISGFTIRNSGDYYPDAGILVDSSDYVEISKNIIRDNDFHGIVIRGCSLNVISWNTVTQNERVGIYIQHSTPNTISWNTITANSWGMDLDNSNNNEVFANTIKDNFEYGIYVHQSNDCLIYHNNFDNVTNAHAEYINTWYNPTLNEGNYWSDYTGTDTNSDDIGDTLYPIPGGGNKDLYPLMYEYGTVFVDDDQISGWYDSMHVGTIQEGINSSKDGQIVYVHNGTYNGNLIVNKHLRLLGENMDNVVVNGDGSNDVFVISAVRVNLSGFTMQNGGSGIGIRVYSDSNAIYGNTVKEAAYGIWLPDSADYNLIIHNNLVNNAQNAYDEGINTWDDGYPSAGNYWDDYAGSDNYYGPEQDAFGSDGIGDTPYDVPGGGNQDGYPLMDPWDGITPVPPLDTVYVDDDYNESTPGWGYDHFDKIQDGVDAVRFGGTVWVFSGIYYENVLVDKAVDLAGEDKYTTIVDASGSGSAFSVSTDSVNISGFTITNGGDAGIWVGWYVRNVSITENIVTSNNVDGIYVSRSHKNVISGNTVTENGGSGVALYNSCDTNIVSNNIVANNRIGIYLAVSTDHNQIFDNTIRSNDSAGVYTRDRYANRVDTSYNRFYHNAFIDNNPNAYEQCVDIWDDGYPSGGNYWDDYAGVDEDGDGIGDTPYDILGEDNQDRYPMMYPSYGTIFVDDDQTPGWYDSMHVHAIQEAVDSSSDDGFVYIYNGTYYENVIIDKRLHLTSQQRENVILDGGGGGDVITISADSVFIRGLTIRNGGTGAGIKILSDYNTIFEDSIAGNSSGINLESSSNNTLSNNQITNNEYAVDLSSSSNNNITGNHITDNDYGLHLSAAWDNVIAVNRVLYNNYGIRLQSLSDNNTIYHNNWDNIQNAYDEGTNTWDDGYPSCGNYWSDYLGNDNYRGVNQNLPGSDNVGDTPYLIAGGSNQDDYPLMSPWDSASPVPSPETVWVNDDFDENTPDWGYDHFDNIQNAVDTVASGGIVRVSNGNYNENVAVNKQVDLIGENKDSTIIDGGGASGIYITADSVNISGFLVRNCGSTGNTAGIYLDNSNGLSITGNIITENGFAIQVGGSSENRIFGNTLTENSGDGIWVRNQSYNNILYDNLIANNTLGISLSHGARYNNIFDNMISTNETGVWLSHDSHNNLLYHNNFIGNTQSAGDECTNAWDNAYPSGGNYWDDYTGVDEDWDGIGDMPYMIPSGINRDNYPLMYPWYPTIFVDDDQSPEWYDSTHVTTIQEGLNNAISGQIVYVYNGTYNENLNLNKNLRLIGENRDSVVIDGGGSSDVFTLSASGIHISGFTVQNIGSQTGIKIHSDSNAIYNNNIKDAEYGVWLFNSANDNRIFHNNLLDNVQNAYDEGSNEWDDGYPSSGNYWENYSGTDTYSGPGQNSPGSDGVGDTPYEVPGGDNQDGYPLINPWDGTSPVPIRDTVYVDSDYDSSTIGWGYDRFDKIQDGIDAAPLNKTVYVYNDTYFEHLIINKSINLMGEDKNYTIIDGGASGRVVWIYADSVNISGFTIRHSGSEPYDAGIYIVLSTYITLSENIITRNNLQGIFLDASSYNTISGNIITENKSTGIFVKSSHMNVISGDSITENGGDGIYLKYSSDNTVFGNFISNNQYGIIENNTYQTVIFDNIITDNNAHSIKICDNSIAYHNNSINNSLGPVGRGTWDDGYPSGGNYWDDYTGYDHYSGPNQDILGSDGIGDSPYVSGYGGQDRFPLMNPWTGSSPVPPPHTVYVDDGYNEDTLGWGYDHFDKIQDGIDAVASGGHVYVSNGTFYENLVIDKTINFSGEDINNTLIDGGAGKDVISVNADSVRIMKFTIQNSDSGAGIAVCSDDNMIHWNTIRENVYGISVQDSVGGNVIFHNNLLENTTNAYDVRTNTWDNEYPSGGNYWSDYTGTDANEDGIGDTPYDIPGGDNLDRYPLMDPWNEPRLNCGDVNWDELIEVVDVIYLINYLFKHGPDPSPMICVGDANADGDVAISDVVYLINYLFKSGPPPSPDCCG